MILNPTNLYIYYTVLSISRVITVMTITGTALWLCGGFLFIAVSDNPPDGEDKKFLFYLKKLFKFNIVMWILFAFTCFIPTEDTMTKIFVVPYIVKNPYISKVPENLAKVISIETIKDAESLAKKVVKSK